MNEKNNWLDFSAREARGTEEQTQKRKWKSRDVMQGDEACVVLRPLSGRAGGQRAPLSKRTLFSAMALQAQWNGLRRGGEAGHADERKKNAGAGGLVLLWEADPAGRYKGLAAPL